MTLQEWFDSEKRDYGLGLALLGCHSKNRNLLQNLARKQNPRKLVYELKKILDRENANEGGLEVTQVFTDEAKGVTEETPEKENPEQDTGKKLDELEEEADGIVSNKLSDLEYDADDIISGKLEKFEEAAEELLSGKLKIIRDGKEVKYEDLPEDIQKRWNENRDAYKEIRATHEKLKLMEKATPEDRQPLTARITELDELIRENWEVIDGWKPGDEHEPEQELAQIDHKRINANRKYISTNMKKLAEEKDEKKAVKLREKIQERVTELVTAGEEIKEKTVEELKELGIEF